MSDLALLAIAVGLLAAGQLAIAVFVARILRAVLDVHAEVDLLPRPGDRVPFVAADSPFQIRSSSPREHP